MGYIKSLGIIILMVHLTQTQQVIQEEVLEGDQGGQYTSIDNDDLEQNIENVSRGNTYTQLFSNQSRILD